MDTRVDEIADRIYRISTFTPDVPPRGFTFNQFLIDAEEPLLYHTGMRELFPVVSEAVARVVRLDRLRWISFAHLEADECGAMNEFLAAAPHGQVAHGMAGCVLSLNDMCDRPPRPMGDGEALEIGDKTLRRVVRTIATPHVPHNWESQVVYEEQTGTLFCGDLFTQLGDGPAVTDVNLIEPALEAEGLYRQNSCLTAAATVLRSLVGLAPRTLAIMHGSSFTGDGAGALQGLADAYESRLGPETDLVANRGVLVDIPAQPS